MPPQQSTSILLSPSELAYLHTSLSSQPPVRPDARLPTQFRPLIAEANFLPATNGSARLCFADGTEAIVGVKAEVEKTQRQQGTSRLRTASRRQEEEDQHEGSSRDEEELGSSEGRAGGDDAWLALNVEIPGMRDDDELPATLSAILAEALVATGAVGAKLWINRFWHWRLYVDIILLSPPASLPLPLLSLATHLALLSTRLPALKSTGDEDPLFDDDWEASPYLYPRDPTPLPTSKQATLQEPSSSSALGPPVTLLVASVTPSTLLFDPSAEEIAVADTLLAISFAASASTPGSSPTIRILNVRTIDPPARLTPPGVPDQTNPEAGRTEGGGGLGKKEEPWRPPRGGLKRGLVKRVLEMVLKEEKGGVGREVLEGLRDVDLG